MRLTIERIVRLRPAFLQMKLAAVALLVGGLLWPASPALAQFTQKGPKLVGTGAGGTLSQQGYSVALSDDGNTAIVGGNGDDQPPFQGDGAAWVFARNGWTWTQQGQKLFGQGAVGSAGQGFSVAISRHGTIAIVGGPFDNNHVGAAWMFARSSSGVWTQRGNKLVGTSAFGPPGLGPIPEQGWSVALSEDGTTAIVGGPRDDGNFQLGGVGAAWVYVYSGGVWVQQGDKLAGSDSYGNSAQGSSVALSADGNIALVGGPGDHNGVGAAWLFTRRGGVWTQWGHKLVGTGASANAAQGDSVALSADGKTAVVNAPGDHAVRVFTCVTRSAVLGLCTWIQQASIPVGTLGWFPVALSGNGNTLIVGAPNTPNQAGQTGSASVFTRNGGVWTPLGSPLVGTGTAGDAYQGWSVAVSSCNVALVGGIADNNMAGAVWVFGPKKGIC